MLRGHFKRREDPYAGAEKERSAKLASAMRVFGAFLACVALPMAPPDKAIGAAGWVISGTLIAASVASAVRTWKAGNRVSHDELLFYSGLTLAGVATMEWLAGGRTSPYHQIFMLTVFNVALAHPPRRFAAFVPFYVAAIVAPFVYGPWNASDLADATVQVLLTLGAAFAGSVLMQSVRDQNVALAQQGAEDREAAETDSLTGLGNRRALMAALTRRAPLATPDHPLMLTL